jgi:hypothetical protein
MLPTLQQVEEKLRSLGFKPKYKGHLFKQPMGWRKIYELKKPLCSVKIEYIHLPEIRLGPYYILGCGCKDTPRSTGATHNFGYETLRIEYPFHLDMIESVIDHHFYLCAFDYHHNKSFDGTKYLPQCDPKIFATRSGNLTNRIHVEIGNDEHKWKEWVNKLLPLSKRPLYDFKEQAKHYSMLCSKGL